MNNDKSLRWYFTVNKDEDTRSIGIFYVREKLVMIVIYKWCLGLRWDSVIAEQFHG